MADTFFPLNVIKALTDSLKSLNSDNEDKRSFASLFDKSKINDGLLDEIEKNDESTNEGCPAGCTPTRGGCVC